MKMKIDDGKMTEKILNMAKYNIKTVDFTHNDPTISKMISNSAANILTDYFGLYYDNLSRRQKYLYQHVYEFNKGGDKKYRLFKPEISGTGKSSNISYKFIESQLPNSNGYVFKNKAYIMENGIPVTVSPKNSSVLTFNVSGETVFTKKNILIKNPGGNVAGNFTKELEKFMKSDANNLLNSTGFYKKIIKCMNTEHEDAANKIKKGSHSIVLIAKKSATKIAREAEITANDRL